jgi:hypothetical protein
MRSIHAPQFAGEGEHQVEDPTMEVVTWNRLMDCHRIKKRCGTAGLSSKRK